MHTSEFISPAELAAAKPFGRRLAPQTIRTWITRGLDGRKLPAKRCGGRWLIPIGDAETFLGIRLAAKDGQSV